MFGGTASINISNIDKTIPRTASISLSATKVNAGSPITATVRHTDNESGIDITKCKWVYNKSSTAIGTNTASYTDGSFASNPQSLSLTKTDIGTYYLHVLSIDKVGNKTETISNAVQVVNRPPVISSVNFVSKSTNSITISATATDADNDNLTYNLFVSTSPDSGFVKKASVTNQTSGYNVFLTATGLTEFTYYYYYISVSDNKADPISSQVQSKVRTFCPR